MLENVSEKTGTYKNRKGVFGFSTNGVTNGTIFQAFRGNPGSYSHGGETTGLGNDDRCFRPLARNDEFIKDELRYYTVRDQCGEGAIYN